MSFTYNLRQQYLIFVIITTVILIVFSIFTNQYIQHISDDAVNNSSLRVSMSSSINSLHSHVDKANQLLNLFLLSPSNQYRHQFLIEVKTALKILTRISSNPWIADNALQNEIIDIQDKMNELSTVANTLMDMRLKNTKVFPAIAIAEQKMFSAQSKFIEEVNLAIEEVRQTEPLDLELYDDFILIRDKWRRLILAYRLYIIYQMGSLDKNISASTVQNIDVYSNDIVNSINTTFNEHLIEDNIGMQSKIAIETIKKISQRWIEVFNEVKLIQLTGKWRSDIEIILNKVNPIYDEIYYNLSQIEISLNLSSVNDIKNQQRISNIISNYLWIIIFVFICVLSFIYFIIDKILLKPISNLAKSITNNEDINFDNKKIKSTSTEMNDFLSAFSEMKIQIKSREEKLEYMALHDGLTGLPNRILLFDRINVAINNYQRYKKLFALFMLDLNKFKKVNDTLGHKIGDEVLVQVAARLKSILRKTDSIARLGGDEFSILMLNIDDTAIKELTHKINSRLEEPFYVNDHKILIGTSIGIAIFPKHGFNNEMLMQKADLAMYYSKKHNTEFTIYNEELTDKNSKQA
jgi:diguanylate cyclase (GGDEF)-like protein